MLFILLHGFILYYKQTKEKNTNYTYTNISSIKNIVFFLTFSVLLADFHLLSYLSLVPAPPPHPHAPNLLSCCDKDRQFPRFLHHWAWLSLSAVIHGDRFSLRRLKTQFATHSLDLSLWPPPPHGTKIMSCLPVCADDPSDLQTIAVNHTSCCLEVSLV